MTTAPTAPAARQAGEAAPRAGPPRPGTCGCAPSSTAARCELITAGRRLRRARAPRRDRRHARASRSAPTPPGWAARWATRLPAHRRRHRARAGRAGAGRRPLALRRRPAAPRASSRCTRSARSSRAMVRASGRIPQISVVLGPAAGGAAYGPALTDVVIIGPEGRIFVTGPDVVRSVTGEHVDMERLGGPEPHGRRSGVVHVVTETDEEALDAARGSPRCSAPRARCDAEPVEDVDLGAACCRSRSQPGLRRPAAGRRAPRRPRVELHAKWAPEHRHHARPPRRPHRRRHRQQPAAARRLPRLAVGGEGRPVRADVRRVRRAAGRPRRRARLPARRRPGVGRRRTPRREAAARVRRGRRAAGDAGDPQGLRRRLHRDELPLARRHRGVRLAGRRGRGDGRGRGGAHPAPPQAARRRPRDPRRRSRPSWPRSTSGSPAASTGPWRSASSTRSSSPTETRARSPRRSPPPAPARGDARQHPPLTPPIRLRSSGDSPQGDRRRIPTRVSACAPRT